MHNANELAKQPLKSPGSQTYQRLQAALTNEAMLKGTSNGGTKGFGGIDTDLPDIFSTNTAEGGTDESIITGAHNIADLARTHLTAASREELTEKNAASALDQLAFANERLQNAMQRVGYLECQVEVLRDNLKGVPEIRAKASRAIILELEKAGITEKLIDAEETILRRDKQLSSRNQEIELLTRILEAHKKHLSRVEADLQSLEQKPWVRFFNWLTNKS